MTDSRLKSRPAKRSDFLEFYGELPRQSVKARVLEVEGTVRGILGYYMLGRAAVVFSDMRGDIPKMTIWREAKAFMESMTLPAVCEATETSGPLLERLGWRHIDGGVYEWQH